MLVCENISKSYYLGDTRVDALKNINLEIRKGEFVAIVGHSGSGKSTLMNILGCLDRQTAGNFYIGGRNVGRLSPRALSRVRAKEIGFIFQSFNLIESLTAYENVRLPLAYRGIPIKKQREQVNNAICSVAMEGRAAHLPSQLSGGQQQRIAVARAIAGNPSIILADEPTGNLDRENSLEVLSILKSLSRKGKTVVMVTHDEFIARSADKIIRITDGKIDE